jgi:hypothetical protein
MVTHRKIWGRKHPAKEKRATRALPAHEPSEQPRGPTRSPAASFHLGAKAGSSQFPGSKDVDLADDNLCATERHGHNKLKQVSIRTAMRSMSLIACNSEATCWSAFITSLGQPPYSCRRFDALAGRVQTRWSRHRILDEDRHGHAILVSFTVYVQ